MEKINSRMVMAVLSKYQLAMRKAAPAPFAAQTGWLASIARLKRGVSCSSAR